MSLVRERQIPIMPPSLASGLRKLKSDGTGQCLYLVRYCSFTPRKFAYFVLSAWGGRKYLPRSTNFIARESQHLQWSHLAKSLDQATNFEVQFDNNNSTITQLCFLRCKCLYVGACSGGGDLLKVPSQKLDNQCKGLSSFIAGLRRYGIQASRPDLSGL